VVVTPATGFINPSGAIVIGIVAGLVPFFACYKLKAWLGYDDALDTFGVHAVGGTTGAFLTGILATASVNSNLAGDAAKAKGLAKLIGNGLWLEQLKAIGITLVLAVVGTVIIASIVKAVIGLRPTEDVETLGLDLAEHGEEGYHGA
jgi:ammonium transporter, Amt family